MSLIARIWQILTPRQRVWVVAMQGVSIAMAFSTVAGIASIAPFFAVLAEPRLIERNALLHFLYVHGGFTDRYGFVVALGIAFIVVVLIANLVNAVGAYASTRAALSIGEELASRLFGEYLARPYAFHLGINSATLFGRVVYETNRLANGILQNIFTLVTNAVTASFILVSVLLVQPAAAIATIAALAGGYTLIYLGVRTRLLRFGQAQSRFFTEQAQVVSEAFGAIKEVLVLQVQGFFLRRFERAARALSAANAHSQLVGQSPKHLMECVAVAGLVGLALLLGAQREGMGPWLGQLTFLAFAAYRLLPALQQAFAAVVRIRADRAGFDLIAPDLLRALRSADTATAAPPSEPHAPGRPPRAIRLSSVSFRHAPDRPWVLSGVSLEVPACAAVGIVGPNGSGKTTLLDVVAGLLTPTSGQVEVDGVALDEHNRTAWQRHIAYVPQNVFLLDASIAQNIALASAGATIDRQRLLAAARMARLEELISSLPEGYEHRIGERGVRLSGGQRQKLGIARALYHDASVLLLDEATSALDATSEQELLATLGALRGRYTTLLVAHRLSTVRACDIIFQLDGGRIVASGAFDELLERSETFRRMVGVA